MIAEDLNICCESCTSWFVDNEVNEDEPCPRCAGDLKHAHAWNLQTPWMLMKAEMYHAEITRLEKRIEDLNTLLIDECWEES